MKMDTHTSGQQQAEEQMEQISKETIKLRQRRKKTKKEA